MSPSLFSHSNLWSPEVISMFQEPIETQNFQWQLKSNSLNFAIEKQRFQRQLQSNTLNFAYSSDDRRKEKRNYDKEKFKIFMKEATEKAALRNSARREREYEPSMLAKSRRSHQTVATSDATLTTNYGLVKNSFTETINQNLLSLKVGKESDNTGTPLIQSQRRKRKQEKPRDHGEMPMSKRTCSKKVSSFSTASTIKEATHSLHEIKLNKQFKGQGAPYAVNTTTMATAASTKVANSNKSKQRKGNQNKSRRKMKMKQKQATEELYREFLNEVVDDLGKPQASKKLRSGKRDSAQMTEDSAETKEEASSTVAYNPEPVMRRPQPYLSRYSELAFVNALSGIEPRD